MLYIETMRILCAWLGRTDIRAVNEEQGVGLGPVAQAVIYKSFDLLVLLNNYPESEVTTYLTWLKSKTPTQVNLHIAPLTSPTDFREIYVAAVTALKATTSEYGA